MRNLRATTTALVGAALLALAGCSTSTTPSTTTTAPTTTGTAGMTTAPVDNGAMIDMTSADLGTILTDGNGRVVYTYDPDSGSGSSTCTGTCAATWPPVTVTTDASAGPGVQSSLLGKTTRADGTLQVTYNGWPLYFYAGDTTSGAEKGQGVGGVWWVIDVSGTQVRG